MNHSGSSRSVPERGWELVPSSVDDPIIGPSKRFATFDDTDRIAKAY